MTTEALDPSWLKILQAEFGKEYMISLETFLQEEKQKGETIYPKCADVFNAFNYTPFDKVKVVILGQDPYHGVGQAHGLCFSVLKGVAIPPSLKNIYKELNNDLGLQIPNHGCLTEWADQGVLLLNATLTVRADKAGSHQNKGWEQFTDTVIQLLSKNKTGLVFLLWGNYAKAKASLIDASTHYILTAAHPSPFSANKGFMGCKHFSNANKLLAEQSLSAINWQITSQLL
ncbi:uracil-DNA glycosylase [Solitalea koreensis]|uniref:Uracil-DNA glycosylase n=1 Tax=Solitalea koreensis TaxID=543615 RepID=A0A521ECK5_9SPHI|nr:uracil-DNA glycosylase [Solitalea koreensis]SMO81532.1 Uracil-DNA glycosylase [Solitalea koreensis]